jgi:mono/diheme cytochrome c family protein
LKRYLTVGLILIGSAAAFFAAAAKGEDDGNTVAKGRAIVKTNCARCHAIGKGDTSLHPEAPPFRMVVTRYAPDNLAEALAEGIVSGHPDMPEFVFQPAEIEAIVAYLNTLAPAREPPANKN